MTQEDKNLLLKDLCARLPYGVKLLHIPTNEITTLEIISNDAIDGDIHDLIENFRPYLFPLSSMTYRQKCTCPIGFTNLVTFIKNENWSFIEISPNSLLDFINWCYKNHLDINGLIPVGLALDATGLNIY